MLFRQMFESFKAFYRCAKMWLFDEDARINDELTDIVIQREAKEHTMTLNQRIISEKLIQHLKNGWLLYLPDNAPIPQPTAEQWYTEYVKNMISIFDKKFMDVNFYKTNYMKKLVELGQW